MFYTRQIDSEKYFKNDGISIEDNDIDLSDFTKNRPNKDQIWSKRLTPKLKCLRA